MANQATPTAVETLATLESVDVNINLQTNAYSFSRILFAYEKDQQLTGHSLPFEEWLLAIIFDWVSEVEKPTPHR